MSTRQSIAKRNNLVEMKDPNTTLNYHNNGLCDSKYAQNVQPPHSYHHIKTNISVVSPFQIKPNIDVLLLLCSRWSCVDKKKKKKKKEKKVTHKHMAWRKKVHTYGWVVTGECLQAEIYFYIATVLFHTLKIYTLFYYPWIEVYKKHSSICTYI